MMHLTIECSEYKYDIEIPETKTVKSFGAESVVDFRKFTEDMWLYWLDYGKRCVYDGAHSVKGLEKDEAQILRQKDMDHKVKALHGEREMGTKTGDPVASAMRPLALDYLASQGRKRKDVPKLGTSVDEICKTLKALGVKKGKLDQIVQFAKDRVAAAEQTRKLLCE